MLITNKTYAPHMKHPNLPVGIEWSMESYKMWHCRIYSYKYGVNIPLLLDTALSNSGCHYDIYSDDMNLADIDIREDEKDALCSAVCDVILDDLAPYEICDIMRDLDFEQDMRSKILHGAGVYAKKAAMRSNVRTALYDYFRENNALVLEGFIMFRMHDTREIWERCVEKATEDVILSEEEYELATLLYELINCYSNTPREVTLIIHEQTGYSIIDDMGTHIDYPEEATDSVLGMLCSIAPDVINVYDMTAEKKPSVTESVKKLFPNKVRIFTVINTH